MKISLTDRLFPILCYCTFGIFSVVLLIFFNLIKCKISKFLLFNILQSIFISVILAAISAIYSFFVNIINNLSFDILFIKNIVRNIDLFLNNTPLIFSFTITSFIIFLGLVYLSVMSFLGNKPYLPVVSNIVDRNMGV